MESSPVVAALTSTRGSAAVATGDIGGVLRVSRRALRLTQADLAARTGYSQPTISRAEQGKITDLIVLGDLADALDIPPAAVGLTPFESSNLDPMDRRDVLQGVLAVASAAMLPAAIVGRDSARIGLSDVQRCRDALDRLYELDYIQGGRPVYELTAGMARRLQDTLGRASYTPKVGRDLRAVAAATCENAGWQAFDAGRFDDAHRWWLEARHVASLGDGATEAHVITLASMSLEASEIARRGQDAVAFAQAAAEVAGTTMTPTLRSLLHAREGLGYAVAGDPAASAVAFGRAHRSLDRANMDDAKPTWLSFYGPSDLAWHEVTAARLARRPYAAEQSAREAVEQSDPVAMPRNHAIYTAGLGHILASAGRYDEAISVSRDVLANRAIGGSIRPLSVLWSTADELSRSSYPQAEAFAAAVSKVGHS